jgi:hypothetical protein
MIEFPETYKHRGIGRELDERLAVGCQFHIAASS